MRMTLEEVKETCRDWLEFCESTGVSEWAINEGGGHVEVELTVQEAQKLGILRLPSSGDW